AAEEPEEPAAAVRVGLPRDDDRRFLPGLPLDGVEARDPQAPGADGARVRRAGAHDDLRRRRGLHHGKVLRDALPGHAPRARRAPPDRRDPRAALGLPGGEALTAAT